ncbi:gliding motility-associated C-terminal domain-containing protein [Ferruginibacter sp.]|nr:PKD domain-containing protein [Ferruginibacter sp.]
MRIFILVPLLLLSLINVNAQQQCQGPGREPGTAQTVCGNLTFVEKQVSNCNGPNLPNPTAGCGDIVTTDNSLWYKFHCYQAGTFGFLITPVNGGDDFDWEIMDITGHPVGDVYTTELRVSLNLSGQTGATGCTATGISDVNCGGGNAGTQFNKLINLVAGHDYLMMVNNWSSSGQGYNIDFSGTAVLTDNSLPAVTDVSVVGCDASKLKVTFSEDILCTSISPATNSEFSVTNGTHVITGIASSCAIGANGVPYVIINFQAPLPAANYQLNVGNGGDGNTLENVCKRLMLPVSVPFTVAAINPVEVNTINYSGCAPTILDVKLTKPVWCSSVTFPGGAGNEFSIQPGNIPISFVQAICSGAVQSGDLLRINLQNPLPHGNYQLVVNNGADGNTFIDTCGNQMIPVTIPFVINQTTVAPIIQSVSFNECQPDKLVLNFDKPVLCSTISSPAEFTISPGVWQINTVTYNCTNNSYTTQVVLNLQNPLTAGNFAVTVGNGTDNNTLADTCFAFIPVGYNKAFVTTQAPLPKFDSLQFDKCNPSFVKLFYSKPVKCSSVNLDGSDYTITGPSAVNINAAVTDGNCGTLGYTKWVLLQFAQPVNTFGNYLVNSKTGNDGTGIIDTCSAVQSSAETISFTALIKPSAVFTSQVKFGCVMDTITFSHPGGNGINSWAWTFSDGSTATGQTVTKLFPVSTPTINIQLIVNNGFCSDTVSNTVTLGNSFNAAFTINPTDTTCINTPVNFINNSTGNSLQYLWLFGDNTQFAGQTPPVHTYTSSNIFNIKLIVADAFGCTDTASVLLNVAAMPTIDFTGLGTQYCTDKTIALTKVASGNINSYTWNNGNGITIQNQPQVQFSYPGQGNFTISLTGTDKYCGTITASKPVSIFAVPKINLGNDTVLCPAVTLQIGEPFTNGYTYLWSNGATTAQIMTDIITSNYAVEVNNNGCIANDAISVKVLAACLIRMPNAFTPNNDGNNDVLRATNADLAKEFSLKIYNRMGEVVFASTNPSIGWNGIYKGARADQGTYVWQLSYIDPWSFKKVVENGASILIR